LVVEILPVDLLFEVPGGTLTSANDGIATDDLNGNEAPLANVSKENEGFILDNAATNFWKCPEIASYLAASVRSCNSNECIRP